MEGPPASWRSCIQALSHQWRWPLHTFIAHYSNSCKYEKPLQNEEHQSLYLRLTLIQPPASPQLRDQTLSEDRQLREIQETKFLYNSGTQVSDLIAPKRQSVLKDQRHCTGADPATYAPILRSLEKVKNISDGKRVHDYILKTGLERNGFLVNLLIQLYCNYGALKDARALFFGVNERSLFSWNTMVRSYSYYGQSKDSIQFFELMQQEGVLANKYIVVSLLSACACPEALTEGKRLHSRIMNSGYEYEVVVGTALLNMYGKSGSLKHARIMFSAMQERDTISWNAMIVAYSQHEQGKEALELYDQMLQEGTLPNKVTFAAVFDACASEGTLVKGKQVHACIADSVFESDVVVGTALINMYGTLSNVVHALLIFDKMYAQDVVLWNTMIAAYAVNGQRREALKLFDQMRLRGVLPDKVTFMSNLSACAAQASLLEGKQLHVLMRGSGIDSDVAMGNALIHMYGKCASLQEAWSTFSEMYEQDIFSWSSIITAYAQNGQGKKCLQIFGNMQKEGMIPNKVTFVSIVEVCASHTALSEGKRIHACMTGTEIESDVVVGTALINMYGKCRSLEAAWCLFANMPVHDMVSWNTMIAAYAQNRKVKDALQLVDWMQREGLTPDKVTFSSLLSACSIQAASSEGKQIHAFIMGSEFKSDNLLGSALVTMYGNCGNLADARNLFDQILERDTMSWNAMITACSQNGQCIQALQFFDRMQQEGEFINSAIFGSILPACTTKLDITKGKQIHALIVGSGLESDIVVGPALVNMYNKCGTLEDSRSMFDNIVKQEVTLWNTIISAYAQHGHFTDALQFFEQMQAEGFIPDKATFSCLLSAFSCPEDLIKGKRMHAHIINSGVNLNATVGNALLNMYEICGSLDYAIRMFEKMPELNKSMLVSIISACARHGALLKGKQMHALIVESGYDSDVLMGNTLTNMYGKCGSLEDALMVFHKLSDPDVISYSAIISAYAQHGRGMEALQLYNEMQFQGIIPNRVTFVNTLSACSHAGMVEEGCHQFLAMNQHTGIAPILDHYHCMIDLLGRAGLLNEAEGLINTMPFQATTVTWTTLLSACRNQVDVQRGERAARNAFALDPKDAAPHVMLSNIYAMSSRGEDAAKVLQYSG